MMRDALWILVGFALTAAGAAVLMAVAASPRVTLTTPDGTLACLHVTADAGGALCAYAEKDGGFLYRAVDLVAVSRIGAR